MHSVIRGCLLAALIAHVLPSAAQASGNCGNRPDLGRGRQLRVIALTDDQQLVWFRECAPQRVRAIGPVRGLGGPDGALIGIDYRVQDGKLYGVGDGGGVYALDPVTADATFVSQLTIALDGTQFGVDFNPAADRLRIVSDTGQNLRHNLNPGGATTADLALNNQGPVATGVSGAAYTNNDLDPNSATSLFDVDATQDQVVIQSPPNNGVLAATGKLALDAGVPIGFDIYTARRSGVSILNHGFAALSVNGAREFHRVNLLTGQALKVGALGAAVQDIALPLDQ